MATWDFLLSALFCQIKRTSVWGMLCYINLSDVLQCSKWNLAGGQIKSLSNALQSHNSPGSFLMVVWDGGLGYLAFQIHIFYCTERAQKKIPRSNLPLSFINKYLLKGIFHRAIERQHLLYQATFQQTENVEFVCHPFYLQQFLFSCHTSSSVILYL